MYLVPLGVSNPLYVFSLCLLSCKVPSISCNCFWGHCGKFSWSCTRWLKQEEVWHKTRHPRYILLTQIFTKSILGGLDFTRLFFHTDKCTWARHSGNRTLSLHLITLKLPFCCWAAHLPQHELYFRELHTVVSILKNLIYQQCSSIPRSCCTSLSLHNDEM